MGKRLLFVILAIGILAVGGTWIVVQKNADQILEEQAKLESLAWAEFVKQDLPDLERLLTGAPPTIQDIRTLSTAKNVGNVYWFKLYDHDRSVVWSADFKEIGDINSQDFFLEKVMVGEKHVDVRRIKNPRRVSASAFFPIMQGNEFKGAIEVSLDLSHIARETDDIAFTLTLSITTLFVLLLGLSAFFVRGELQKERRLKIEALQAAKARNDFIALVSHELRTPLNGILGALGLLGECKEDREREKLTTIAMLSTDHLKNLINGIIDLTQLEGKRASLNPQIVDLNLFCDEIEVIFSFDADKKGLIYRVVREFDVEVSGEADLKVLRQIVFNLVTNAIKYTDEGTVSVTLSLEGIGKGRRLCCRVADTGVGLSAQEQKDIFKRFYQLGDTMSRKQGGIGLGLTLCRELSALMQGNLVVESEVGKGSVFTLNVPFPETVSNKVTEQNLNEHQGVHLNLLLAEDNQVNQKVLSSVLRKAGHSVELVDNGMACVDLAARQSFDMILMDIQMPEMTGLDATLAIRQGDGPNAKTPIIALSANVMPEQLASYGAAGMQDYLAKPIKPQDLRRAVWELYRQYAGQI